MTDYRPAAVSEWFDPDGHIDQCGWCSTLMLANKASLGKYPATLAFSKTLGQGASSIADNNTGLGRELGFHGVPLNSVTMAQFLAALTSGMGAVVQGYYAGLPPHFTRFDRNFAAKGSQSRHATYVQREADGRIWWIDPLFHGEPGYKGEFIPVVALTAFATTYHTKVQALLIAEGSHAPDQGGPQQPEAPVSTFIPKPGRFSVKAGAPYFDAPDGTKAPIGRFPVDNDHVEELGGIVGWRVGIVASAAPGDLAVWIPANQGTDVPLPAPADCKDAVNAALDHVAGPAAAVSAAVQEARPR